MPRRIETSVLVAAVATGLALASAQFADSQQTARAAALGGAAVRGLPGGDVPGALGFTRGAMQQQTPPPTEAELRARADKVVANQHRNDQAAELYEYVEHEISRTGGAKPRTEDEKVYRVVPTGTGTLKILLKDNGKAVDAAEYRRQLQRWEAVLQLMLNPADPRTASAYAKSQKKKHDRADMVDAMQKAFVPKWIGRETADGRPCDVIELDPNPQFHPRSILQEVLARVVAKIWVDPDSDQLVRGEARVIRDLSVGGGILGKLYRGGVFSMDQSEVAPGVWLPARYQYDFSGRKFLFSFEMHQVVNIAQYRRVGDPKEALQVVKDELASGKPESGDP